MKKVLLVLGVLAVMCGSGFGAEAKAASIWATLDEAPEFWDSLYQLIKIDYSFTGADTDTCRINEFYYTVNDTADWQAVPLRLLVENGYGAPGKHDFKWCYKYQINPHDTVIIYLRFRVGNKDACEGGWTTLAPMSRARWRHAAGVVDGKLYAVGGGNSPAAHWSLVEEYDPATDTWTTKAPLPSPQDALAVDVIDGKVYAVGGYNGGYNYLHTLTVYDPAADTWETRASMKVGRAAPAAAAVNGKLYVFGGSDQVADTILITDVTEEYDPATDTWTTKAPMPTKRVDMATAVVDGKIYVIGGSFHYVKPYIPTFYNVVEVYDPATDTWSTRAPMPSKRKGMRAGVIDGKIYVVGGQCDTLWSYPSPTYQVRMNDVEIYDPATDSWTTGPLLPTPRTDMAMGVIDGTMYVIGGQQNGEAYDPASYLDIVEAYKPAASARVSNYLKTPPLRTDDTGILRPVLPEDESGQAISVHTGVHAPLYNLQGCRVYRPDRNGIYFVLDKKGQLVKTVLVK